MSKLKEAVWAAAGWGPTRCQSCGAEMVRVVGLASASIGCSDVECMKRSEKEMQRTYRYAESEE